MIILNVLKLNKYMEVFIMDQMLVKILTSVLTLLALTLTTFIIRFLSAKVTQIKDEKVRKMLSDAVASFESVIPTIVLEVQQTYVDSLKNKNAFNSDCQVEALNKAIETAKILIPEHTQSIITQLYGDFETYLKTCIEAEVKNLKISTGK